MMVLPRPDSQRPPAHPVQGKSEVEGTAILRHREKTLDQHGLGEGITPRLLCAVVNSFFKKATSSFCSPNIALPTWLVQQLLPKDPPGARLKKLNLPVFSRGA